jgi:tRNA threonylcarbamoyladenosine biosynthesis protein TsaB
MAIFLNIETSGESASIALSEDSKLLQLTGNDRQKDHASWLHTAIKRMLESEGVLLPQLDAVAVSIGPGSYTGLRVGLSAAKGICFAMNIPLITIGTLEIIASASNKTEADLYIPLIDARRMEVFTAVYDKSLKQLMQPSAMIIDQNSFATLLEGSMVCFCGNGQKKLHNIISHPQAIFDEPLADAREMVPITHKRFIEREFSNLAYTEPLYVKEFYTTIPLLTK